MTGRLTLEQQGALKLLLDHQWMEGALPDDSVIMARIIGLTVEDFAARIWPFISRHFFTKKSGLLNPEMEKQRRVQVAFRREQSRKGIRSGQLRREQRLNSGSSPVRTESQPESNSASASPSPRTTQAKDKDLPAFAGKVTWLTPYDVLWQSFVGGRLPFGEAGTYLKPIHAEHGERAVLEQFGKYLEVTAPTPQYLSLKKFASAFGAWGKSNGNGAHKPTQTDRNMAVLRDEWRKADGL